MTPKEAVIKALREWCEAQQWDWLLELPSPAHATAVETDRKLRQWLDEIEQADGTMAFRWARFIPRSAQELSENAYILVGGLSSGECLCWAWRWGAINADIEWNAGFEYRYRGHRKPVRSALRRLLAGKRFIIEVGVGPRIIHGSRRLEEAEAVSLRRGQSAGSQGSEETKRAKAAGRT